MCIWPCFLAPACYRLRVNVFEQITWLRNWRKCGLILCFKGLTSAALNPLNCFCIFSCSTFLIGCLLLFVLKLTVSLLDSFILLRILNSPFYVIQGKTSYECSVCVCEWVTQKHLNEESMVWIIIGHKSNIRWLNIHFNRYFRRQGHDPGMMVACQWFFFKWS